MQRTAVLTRILVGMLVLIGVPVLAAGPEGMKLYVFTSGSIGGFSKSAIQIGGQGTVEWAPIGFYVIKHPKGNVIFDTGNNDKTITDPDGYWGPLASEGVWAEDDPE
jgi:N-acyl homoserine lactone hydrolase